MTATVRTLTQDDKALLKAVMFNAGIKYRARHFPGMIRLVFEGSWEPVAEALNDNGFRPANGQPWTRFSFDGNQAFIRYVTN